MALQDLGFTPSTHNRRMVDYKYLQSDHLENGESSSASTSSTSRRFRQRPPISIYTFLYFIQHTLTVRRLAILIIVIPVVLVLIVLSSGIPPSYEDIRLYERNLPQHNHTEAVFETSRAGNSEVSRERRHRGKYLKFEGALWGHGLNNVLQEIILMSYLAHMTHRSFVFQDYVWSKSPFPYTIYDLGLRPSRIPLNAFISGPSAGGPVSGDDPRSQRSVSLDFFETICLPDEIVILSSVGAPVDKNAGKGADEILAWWVDALNKVRDEPCVVIDTTEKKIFDMDLFGSKRILSIMPSLQGSPILADFKWSPLVQSAITRNFAILQPSNPKPLYDFSAASTLSGIVAVHLRRGDFSRHCRRLGQWQANYMGMNQLEELPDKFDLMEWLKRTKEADSSTTDILFPKKRTEEDEHKIQSYYFQHCFPNIDQIVGRLHQVRIEHPSLKKVYLLSNGWKSWLSKLSERLKEDGWEGVQNTYDLVLDSEQTHVGMAVDMAIAEKAEVFVGNGFSSLSANIIMLRLAKGIKAVSNRFL